MNARAVPGALGAVVAAVYDAMHEDVVTCGTQAKMSTYGRRHLARG